MVSTVVGILQLVSVRSNPEQLVDLIRITHDNLLAVPYLQ
jgi:hypothetical protein